MRGFRFLRAPLPLLSILAVSGCVVLLSTSSSDAGSITYTVPLDSEIQPGMFPQFDPSLGVLKEVDVSATGHFEQEFKFWWPVDSVSYSSSVELLAMSYSGVLGFGGQNFVTNLNPLYPPQQLDLALGGYFSITDTITSGLGVLYGTGQVNLQISSMINILATDPTAPYYPVDIGSACGSATVTYRFSSANSAVPEPSGVTLLGLGLLSVLIISRSRHAYLDAEPRRTL
jgi:hypothetical protein